MANTDAVMVYDGMLQPTECGYAFHINDAADHLIRTGPALLLRIVANQTGDADWVASIYDGTDATGTLIGNCDANNGGNYEFGVVLQKGLFIHCHFTGSGTKSGDITVVSVGV